MQDGKSPKETKALRGMPPRRAAAIALGAGAFAGIGVALSAPEVPWWMPILLFAIVAGVVWRLLRPHGRRIGWEDEV